MDAILTNQHMLILPRFMYLVYIMRSIYPITVADKIDTLVGFFGVNQKPTSSKDPFALRRLALGIVRIMIENKKDFKIRDLINYSSSLYQDQGFEFENKSLQKELLDFILERLKYYMKEENIRNDIILASISSSNLDQSVIIFNKAKNLNKIINKQNGIDIISSYKRASNILESELKKDKIELSNTTDPGIFKTELEKKIETLDYSSIEWRPLNYVDLDKEKSDKLLEVLTSLEELDDVQNIFTNANLKNIQL